jgi:putative permease
MINSSVGRNFLFAFVFFVGISLVIHFLLTPIAPFLISFVIAYLLKPILDVQFLKKYFSRIIAVLGIVTLFTLTFISIIAFIIPIIYNQVSILVKKIPDYQNYFANSFGNEIAKKIGYFSPKLYDQIKEVSYSIVDNAFGFIGLIGNNIWNYTITTINICALLLLVPIILFYLLRDWDKMISGITELIPLSCKNKTIGIIADIDKMLSAYLRGQLNICLILSFCYSLGLSLIGIDVSLLLGLLSGFFIVLPFIGIFISFSIAILICYFELGDSSSLYMIISLYVTLHIFEAYILTPIMIGDRIGLHPLWIMFSVFVNGSLFSLLGIMFAIPIAGTIKILFKRLRA